jgi:hypothetical protein
MSIGGLDAQLSTCLQLAPIGSFSFSTSTLDASGCFLYVGHTHYQFNFYTTNENEPKGPPKNMVLQMVQVD